MKDKILISLTQVTDDDTGVWQVGELDYSIHVGALEDYLKKNGVNGKKEIHAMLGHLAAQVDKYFWDTRDKGDFSTAKEASHD